MTMIVNISGTNPKFVDGEAAEFKEYAAKKALRVEKLTDSNVLNVRIGTEGRKVKVSVDVDGDVRTDGIGTTAFSAIDRAVDTVVNRLRKKQDKRVDKKVRETVEAADEVSSRNDVQQ